MLNRIVRMYNSSQMWSSAKQIIQFLGKLILWIEFYCNGLFNRWNGRCYYFCRNNIVSGHAHHLLRLRCDKYYRWWGRGHHPRCNAFAYTDDPECNRRSISPWAEDGLKIDSYLELIQTTLIPRFEYSYLIEYCVILLSTIFVINIIGLMDYVIGPL